MRLYKTISSKTADLPNIFVRAQFIAPFFGIDNNSDTNNSDRCTRSIIENDMEIWLKTLLVLY